MIEYLNDLTEYQKSSIILFLFSISISMVLSNVFRTAHKTTKYWLFERFSKYYFNYYWMRSWFSNHYIKKLCLIYDTNLSQNYLSEVARNSCLFSLMQLHNLRTHFFTSMLIVFSCESMNLQVFLSFYFYYFFVFLFFMTSQRTLHWRRLYLQLRVKSKYKQFRSYIARR